MPDAHIPYPKTWVEAAKAPWPWRVREVLNVTWRSVNPRTGPSDRTKVWLEECLSWPITNGKDARFFVESTAEATRMPTLPVLARWRRILLDERMPKAARLAASCHGPTHNLEVEQRATSAPNR